MRCMIRNTRTFYYANYASKTPILDANGFDTGEYTTAYSSVTEARGNISPARGEADMRAFGIGTPFDKVIVMDDPQIPIDEYSVLWVDVPTTDAPDYIVRRVARSLNSVAIAIARVDVDNA